MQISNQPAVVSGYPLQTSMGLEKGVSPSLEIPRSKGTAFVGSTLNPEPSNSFVPVPTKC